MLVLFMLTACVHVGVVEGAASVQIGPVTLNGFARTFPFDSNVYYGIKYADAARWSNPVPVDPTTFNSPYVASVNDKPMCMQKCVSLPLISCVSAMDEDCLYLNIYTPSSASPSSNLPVLFFIHGGSFTEGTGAAFLYESDRLVREGVIVVTINYRLGIFGFLGAGNYGLRDQREALKWVYDYIINFGGNPNQITAMGQSAGASSVNLLLVEKSVSNLIYRVILISSPFTLRFRTPEQGQYMQSTFEGKVGCTLGSTDCGDLAAADVLDLQDDPDVRNYDNNPLSEFSIWGPVIDNPLVPNHAFNLYKNGDVHLKDTLLGTTRNEGVGYVVTGSPTGFFDLYFTVLAIEPSLISTIWQYEYVPDTRFTLADIATDYVFRCVAREVAQLIDAQQTVYRYEFDDLFPAFPIFNGVCDDFACHGNDLTYIFGSLNYAQILPPPLVIPFTPDDVALSDAIVGSFTRFMKGQSPTQNPFKWRRNGFSFFPFISSNPWSYILREGAQFSTANYFSELWKCGLMDSLTSYNPEYPPTGK